MIVSGAQSGIAGVAFIIMANMPEHGSQQFSWVFGLRRILLSDRCYSPYTPPRCTSAKGSGCLINEPC